MDAYREGARNQSSDHEHDEVCWHAVGCLGQQVICVPVTVCHHVVAMFVVVVVGQVVCCVRTV